MKKVISVVFFVTAFNITNVHARMTSADPGMRDHPPEIGEIDAYFNSYANQDVPKHEKINEARGSSSGSGAAANPCGNRRPGNDNKSDVVCSIDQFTSTFATQDVPHIPHDKMIKHVDDGQRGNNQEEFLNKDHETATGSGHSQSSGVGH